jgi:IPT/TIG domain
LFVLILMHVDRVDPRAAVEGAAISIRGSGLGGNGTRASVGGRKAKLLSARAHELRIVVPSTRPGLHPVIVRRGRLSSRGRLRVVRPFRGKLKVRVDRRRMRVATIGIGGGEMTATGAGGVRYTLRVAPGSLAARWQSR